MSNLTTSVSTVLKRYLQKIGAELQAVNCFDKPKFKNITPVGFELTSL